MSDTLDISALQMIQPLATKGFDRSGSGKPLTPEQMKQKAQEYEAQVLGSMLKSMSTEVNTEDDMFNGGTAEETWRGMLNEEYGKIIARSGGIGLADSIVHELVRMQANATANKESPL